MAHVAAVFVALFCLRSSFAAVTPTAVYQVPAKDLWGMKVNSIEGNPVSIKAHLKNVLLVTNVASKCGYTESNYAELVQLDKAYNKRGFEIMAFPCNQFGAQEPDSPTDIKTFAKNKGVTFKMMEKIDVNGPKEHPFYKMLKGTGGDIKWNFATKFLIMCDTSSPAHMCKVERYDGQQPPKALKSQIERYLKKDEF